MDIICARQLKQRSECCHCAYSAYLGHRPSFELTSTPGLRTLKGHLEAKKWMVQLCIFCIFGSLEWRGTLLFSVQCSFVNLNDWLICTGGILAPQGCWMAPLYIFCIFGSVHWLLFEWTNYVLYKFKMQSSHLNCNSMKCNAIRCISMQCQLYWPTTKLLQFLVFSPLCVLKYLLRFGAWAMSVETHTHTRCICLIDFSLSLTRNRLIECIECIECIKVQVGSIAP